MSNERARNALRRLKPVTVVLVIVAVVVLLVLGFSSFFVVDQQEEAVVLRFGKFLRISLAGPSLQDALRHRSEPERADPAEPQGEFGFRTVSAGVRSTYSSQDYSYESIMLTGDLLIVDVEWIIQYQIVDAKAFLFNVYDPEKTIRDISQSVISQHVGDRQIDAVLTQDRAAIEDQGPRAHELALRSSTSSASGSPR